MPSLGNLLPLRQNGWFVAFCLLTTSMVVKIERGGIGGPIHCHHQEPIHRVALVRNRMTPIARTGWTERFTAKRILTGNYISLYLWISLKAAISVSLGFFMMIRYFSSIRYWNKGPLQHLYESNGQHTPAFKEGEPVDISDMPIQLQCAKDYMFVHVNAVIQHWYSSNNHSLYSSERLWLTCR